MRRGFGVLPYGGERTQKPPLLTQQNPKGRTMTDVRKDAISVIRIQRRTYKSHEFVDLRLWVLGDTPNEYVATQKGVTITPDRLDEVIAALTEMKS